MLKIKNVLKNKETKPEKWTFFAFGSITVIALKFSQ